MKSLVAVGAAALAGLTLCGCPAQVVKEGVQQIPKLSVAQCAENRDIFQKAVDSYTLLEGHPPPNEAAMVPDYIHELSPYFDVDAQGHVIPAPNNVCK
jgi:hypothetical protein